MPRKKRPARLLKQPTPSSSAVPRELKIALLAAIPFGIAAAVMLDWESLFPVPPEQLVEVVWRHECSCAGNWMKALRAEGFVVRDFELDDLSTNRQRWHVPDTIHGCHPATYMGYFIDGHVTAENLRRLAREHPAGIGLQIKGTGEGVAQDMVLVDQAGLEKPWP